MINTNLFSETMKVDNGNLSSEDDNYFSDTEDKQVETTHTNLANYVCRSFCLTL